MKKTRSAEGINLSFLDVISCGFGAVLLMLVLVRTFSPEPEAMKYEPSELEEKISELMERNQEVAKKLIALERLREHQDNTSEKIDSRLSKLKEREEDLSLLTDKSEKERKELQEKKRAIKQEIETIQAGEKSISKTVAGIKIDSEYIIFIIDTSGSMRSDWLNVLNKVEQILINFPSLKGIQIMDADGDLLFPYQGLVWNNADRKSREMIMSALETWPEQSLSNPEKGIKKAITSFYSPNKKIAIWVFADDYQGNKPVESLVKFVDNINAREKNGERLVTINAIGFRTGFESSRMRFALAMRELCERNGGAFIGL